MAVPTVETESGHETHAIDQARLWNAWVWEVRVQQLRHDLHLEEQHAAPRAPVCGVEPPAVSAVWGEVLQTGQVHPAPREQAPAGGCCQSQSPCDGADGPRGASRVFTARDVRRRRTHKDA
ncbi:hypothetical protein BaRGS_00027490 [Batillaria attramentaria]|uniref:Uncharacterized protein n=1 Tax=Batillaria attramentaria TaxID=370345 RepID=A0ABD0K2N4_9CAEN